MERGRWFLKLVLVPLKTASHLCKCCLKQYWTKYSQPLLPSLASLPWTCFSYARLDWTVVSPVRPSNRGCIMRLQICLISKFSSKLLSDAPPRVCYRNRNNLENNSIVFRGSKKEAAALCHPLTGMIYLCRWNTPRYTSSASQMTRFLLDTRGASLTLVVLQHLGLCLQLSGHFSDHLAVRSDKDSSSQYVPMFMILDPSH